MLVAWLMQTVRAECKAVKPCSVVYSAAVDVTPPDSDVPFCKVLSEYSKCVNRIPRRACRGDLTYHSTLTIIEDFMGNYNCTFILEQDELRRAAAAASTPRPTEPPMREGQAGPTASLDTSAGRPHPRATHPPSTNNNKPYLGRCEYPGNRTYKHCGLFGDPHLRTFDDQFQTCRVAGAWPLIYNEYIAVQVTNVPLVHGSGATATNKLSVIIKDHDECAERKLYQATSGNLPAYFVDGTQEAGYGHSVIIAEIVPGEHVEIHIKYIATVIVIRQQGQYLQFAIRMPEDLIHGVEGEDNQLCVRGCPSRERINYKEFLKDFETEKSQRQSSVAQCREANVIDDYLDSCVFDLLTTGDQNFTKAAQHAMMDVNRLHPKASVMLKNRTSVFEDEELYNLLNGSGENSASSTRTNSLLRLQLFSCLFVMLLVRQVTTCVT